MDLEERIARLIDPEAWETVARGEAIGLPSAQVFVNDSLAAAIETLNVPDDASSLTNQEDQS